MTSTNITKNGKSDKLNYIKWVREEKKKQDAVLAEIIKLENKSIKLLIKRVKLKENDEKKKNIKMKDIDNEIIKLTMQI